MWDSCFIAIGLAHIDPHRAAQELLNLGRGQWQDGMLPHMIFSSRLPYKLEDIIWGHDPRQPRGVTTSAITQPPMLAIAAEQVARALPEADRTAFVGAILPVAVKFHDWLYRERDPRSTGLPACLHSWESGLDDTPPWTEAMERMPPPPLLWRLIGEYRHVNPAERATRHDVQHMLSLVHQLRIRHYDSPAIIRSDGPTLAIQDLVFLGVLARANESLEHLAEMAGQPLSEALRQQFAPTRHALERQLWDPATQQYYSRDYQSGRLLTTPTVATFMPLFAGTASPARARQLRDLLADPNSGFNPPHAVPAAPTTSPFFEAQRYWRGPVWINMNWFIIRGLERYGFTVEAERLCHSTLKLLNQSGFREYFNSITGEGLGADHFSWSAALALDLLQ